MRRCSPRVWPLIVLVPILVGLVSCRKEAPETPPVAEQAPAAGQTAPSDTSVVAQLEPSGEPVAQACGSQGVPVRIQPSADDPERFALEPDPGYGEAVQSWQGDLNEDGAIDHIMIFPESCGSWGECLFGVYARCSSDHTYVPVWGPEYALDFRVAREHDDWNANYSFDIESADGDTTIHGDRWLGLVRIQRTGDAADAAAVPEILRYGGRFYSEIRESN